mgnify:CR=1 FL=1
MKVRAGFVSNSSSSSFVVAIDHEPTDANDLMGMLFPKVSEDAPLSCELYDGLLTYSVKEISESVFNNLSTDPDEITKSFKWWLDGSPKMQDYNVTSKEGWKAFLADSTKFALSCKEAFMEENKGLFVFTVTYWDETAQGAFMEHGDIFRNVKHVLISFH